LQQRQHRRIAAVQVLGQAQEVQVRPIVQNRSACGDADRAAQVCASG